MFLKLNASLPTTHADSRQLNAKRRTLKKYLTFASQFPKKMKTAFVSLLLVLFGTGLSAQVDFDNYFYNKTLRLDYIHSGTADTDFYALDELIEEPFYGGSKTALISNFDYGNYRFTLEDAKTGTLIWKQGFSTLFSEWQTTAEAKVVNRAFNENVVFPFPKQPVKASFWNRNKQQQWEKRFSYVIDPSSYFIKKERRLEFPYFMVNKAGDPAVSLDIVFVPEGYTANEMDKFKKDCERLTGYLFKNKPYVNYKDRINVYGVEAPSNDEGADIPGKGVWKKTIVNSSFYTFDIERYLTTTDMKSVRDVAANVPYDQICIVANSPVYGGGGIYNFYALFTSDNNFADYVFVHEFGHSFGGLGDEYFESSVAYENFYDLHYEPWEPNLTTLVDFNSKWKSMVKAGTPIPTPVEDKDKVKVGAFEGGGYMAKGIYRPSYDCTMKSISYDNFCPVCADALTRMIESYLR